MIDVVDLVARYARLVVGTLSISIAPGCAGLFRADRDSPFVLALALDQPFGPILAIALATAMILAVKRQGQRQSLPA